MKRPGFKSAIPLLFIAQSLVMVSCGDDDLKNASTISSKKITLTKDRSLGVEIVYSDSAWVKAKGFAPILDVVTPSQGAIYREMPSGVKIEFFNELLQHTGTITSDYAINRETEKITVFKRHVVVVTPDFTFTTEELTWDENKKSYYSPSGTVKSKDGSEISGTEFSAPQDFGTFKIIQATGITQANGDLIPSLN